MRRARLTAESLRTRWEGMRLVRRALGAGVFFGLLVVGWRFAAQNGDPVIVNYLLGEVGASLWAVLLVCFAAGVAAAALVGGYQLAKIGMVARRYRKTVHGLEAEVHQLRNLPLSAQEPAPGLGDGSVAPAMGPVARGVAGRGG